MDLDNFIIGKTKKRRGEERGDLAKKTNSCLANSSHLGVASSKTSSRSSKRRSSRSSKSSGVVVRVVV